MEDRPPTILDEELVEQEPDGYYEKKIEQINAGEIVWVRRNFEADAGLCVDLYKGRQLLGYIDCEHDNPNRPAQGFTAVVYIQGHEGPEMLDPGGDESPTAPAVAAFDLLQYCRRSGLLDS